MSKIGDIFTNQSKPKNKKGNDIPPGFIEMLKQSGEIYSTEEKQKPLESKPDRRQEIETEKNAYFQQVKKLETEIYNRKNRETKQEIEMLRKMLVKEVGKLKKQGQQLQREVEAAVQSPIVNPDESDITFFEGIFKLLKNITENVENASLWVSAWNSKQAKRGAFWSNFASKKGGAQYLLSSEHSAARSAG